MRADAESSCIASRIACWLRWFASLCVRAGPRTLRSSCSATSSQCCTGRTTDHPSPTRTGPFSVPSRRATASKRNRTGATPKRIALLSHTPSDLGKRCGGATCRGPTALNPFRYTRNPFHGPNPYPQRSLQFQRSSTYAPTLWVPETRPWWLTCRDAGRRVGAGNSAVVIVLPRWGPMLSPRVPNLVPIPGPRMERETPGQRPRPNYGHPVPHRRLAGSRSAIGSRTVVVVLAGTRHCRSARPPLCAPEQPEAQPSPSSPPRRQPIGDWF